MKRTAITPTREEDYSEWYQQVVKAADLAEHSPVRGCMVIKPWGYSIWENIQKVLDAKFKETGHQNAYFPLFIPLSFLEREAEHVEGFAKECAVVTHHRLEKGKDGKLIPAGKLEEPLVVRPTSEMIIGEMFSKWIESYRDLPLLINQWANIVRWEMRTRLFLRTTEFLWQEGHTVHGTQEEAIEEAEKMYDIYADFCHEYLAIPVIKGIKTESERFPGAVTTYTMEAMMQDKKALQVGTSHFLGQNFAKSCNIQFRDEDGETKYGWMTSWGVSTRLIGGMLMTHGDDNGLILPPRIASSHIVIIPLFRDEASKKEVMKYSESLVKELKEVQYDGKPLQVILDSRDLRGGEKNWSWIKKGIPIRLEIGSREIESNLLSVARRDREPKDVAKISKDEFVSKVPKLLEEIQNNLLKRAKKFRDQNTVQIDSKEEFYNFFTAKNKKKPEIHGGFALSHWSGDPQVEETVKKDLNVTIRCIPLDAKKEEGKCVITGKPSKKRVLFAKSY